MKKLMVALMLLSLAAVANAQYNMNFIGISADPDLTVCYAGWEAGASVDVYFLVYIDPAEINGVSGAEFRVDSLPIAEAPNVFVTDSWGGLTIGDLGYGFSIALDFPGAGPIVELGMRNYFILTDTGDVGMDHHMRVMETLDSGNLIITDFNFNEIDRDGGMFTWNCSNPNAGGCIDVPVSVAPASWGSIKSLY